MRSFRWTPAVLAWFVFWVVGCDSRPTLPDSLPKDPEGGLKQIGETYKYLADQKLRVPTKLTDLDEYSGNLEAALPLLSSGDLVLFYGIPYSAGSKDILAYEKDASSAGGWVLLRNGTVKKLTAEEFKSSPKAKG